MTFQYIGNSLSWYSLAGKMLDEYPRVPEFQSGETVRKNAVE